MSQSAKKILAALAAAEGGLTEETWLNRPQFCAALREKRGIRISPATLASKASRGGGPPFRRNLDGVAEIQWGPGLAWAEAQIVYRPATPADAEAVHSELFEAQEVASPEY